MHKLVGTSKLISQNDLTSYSLNPKLAVTKHILDHYGHTLAHLTHTGTGLWSINEAPRDNDTTPVLFDIDLSSRIA